MTPATHEVLLAYSWPGNVRELANLMERVALLTDATELTPELVGLPVSGGQRPEGPRGRAGESARDEREALLAALQATQWNLSRAAVQLGMPRNTLRYRIEKYGLRPERGTAEAERPPTAAAQAREVGTGATATAPPPALRWERRWVTAPRVALVPPSGVTASQLAHTLEAFGDKLRGFGAHVEELHAEGFLALFGLQPVEDAPSRAVHAAWAVQKTVEHRNPELGVTCAIHASECLIGRGGAIVDMDPADKGHLLANLDALGTQAVLSTVVVSAETARFLERRFDLARLDRKAEDPALTGYRVVGRGRSGFEVEGLARSPLVGRDRELVILDDLLTTVEQGQGQAVGLSGEAGVGKSRLLYEFCQGLERGRITYLEGRSVSYGQTTPYLPILDIVRQSFALAETDTPEIVAEKIDRGLRALGLDVPALLPYLLHLLGVKEDAEGPLAVLNPESIKARTIDTLRQLSVAGSQQRVIVIAIEDMHWIDQASEDALAAVVESTAGCRVLLVCTYRPGYQPPWLGKSHATQLVLRRLSRRDCAAIVKALPLSDTLSAELTDTIVERADGIPFFLEELARAVSGQTDRSSPVAVPDTLQGVLTARIDRLPPTEKHLLDAAAVLGKDTVIPFLRALVTLTDPEFRQALAHLQAAELLLQTSIAPVPTYRFKHALTQEVAYRNIPAERRRTLHADVAAAIERLAPDVASRTPEILAHHYTEAGLPQPALTHWHRAGKRAMARSANVEAIGHLRRGLALLGTLPDSPERNQTELLFLLTLATPLIMVRGYAASDVGMLCARARVICSEAGNSPLLFPALFALWRYYFVCAKYQEAERLTADLRAAAGTDGGTDLVVAAEVACGLTCFYLGRLGEARDHLQQALHRYDPQTTQAYFELFGQDPMIPALAHLTWAGHFQGFLEGAVNTARTALAKASAGGHPFDVVYGWHFLAITHQIREEHDLASQAAAEEMSVSSENRFPFFLAQGEMIHGASLAECGRVDEGLELIAKGLEASRRIGTEVGGTYYRWLLATAYRRKGLVPEALGALEDALVVAERTGERYWEPELLRLKGQLLLEHGVELERAAGVNAARPEPSMAGRSEDAAERCFEAARRRAREQGAALFELRAVVALSRLWARSGRRDDAERLLEQSLARMPERGTEAADLTGARLALATLGRQQEG